MAESMEVKSKVQKEYEIALENYKAAEDAYEAAMEASDAEPDNIKLLKATEKALKAKTKASARKEKAEAKVKLEEGDQQSIENNELESNGATSNQKIMGHLKQHWKKYAAAAAAVIIAGSTFGIIDQVNQSNTENALGDANNTIGMTAESVLETYDSTCESAEKAIANAVLASNYATEVYNEVQEAETAAELEEAWLKAKGNVIVSAQADKTAYAIAQEAKSETDNVKGSLSTIRQDLDAVQQTQAVVEAKDNIDNVLLASAGAPIVVTIDSESFQVAPKNATKVQYTVKVEDKGNEEIVVSSVVVADTIAQNAVTIADAAAELAQSKLNELEVNDVNLSETQVQQMADCILNNNPGHVISFQSFSYVGEDLVLYFNGDDGFKHNAVYQVTIASKEFTHIKGDQDKFNQEVADYVSTHKVQSVCFISSEGFVGKENQELLNKTLNFSTPGSDTAATLNDVMFNIAIKFSEKAKCTTVTYQVLAKGEDGTVNVLETNSITLEGKVSVAEAEDEAIAHYLEAHQVTAESTSEAE